MQCKMQDMWLKKQQPRQRRRTGVDLSEACLGSERLAHVPTTLTISVPPLLRVPPIYTKHSLSLPASLPYQVPTTCSISCAPKVTKTRPRNHRKIPRPSAAPRPRQHPQLPMTQRVPHVQHLPLASRSTTQHTVQALSR